MIFNFLLFACLKAAILSEKEQVNRTAVNEVTEVNKGHQNDTDYDSIKVLIMDSDDPLDNNVIGLRLTWNFKTGDEKVDLLSTQPNPIFLYDRHLMCSYTFHGKFYMVGGKIKKILRLKLREKNILGEVPESANSTFTKQMPRRRFEVSETEYKQLEDLPFSFSSGN